MIKKKIAFFHPIDDKYGASNILAYIVRFLSKNYICHIYISNVNGSIKNSIGFPENENVKFIEMSRMPLVHRGMYSFSGVFKWLSDNIKAYFLLKEMKNDYDLIYINTISLFSLSVTSRLIGCKNIVHCHEYLAGSIYGKVIKYFVGIGADQVISVSQHVNSYIANSQNKFVVVRNGIPDISEKKEQPYVTNTDHMNFSLVGRVMPEKGHWFLLDTLKKLPPELLAKIKIHVFGDAPPTRSFLMQEFKDKISKYGLDNTIICYGFDPRAAEKISSMDVCLIPSMMADPFPTTVLEAIRLGKVVVATNHGGAREVINHGVNGYLISPGDTNEFFSVIDTIISNGRDKNKIIGQAARDLFVENYTLERYQERFESVLGKVLN